MSVDSSLPQVAAEIGHDVGVFAVLHHDDLLLHHSKVLTCRANAQADALRKALCVAAALAGVHADALFSRA